MDKRLKFFLLANLVLSMAFQSEFDGRFGGAAPARLGPAVSPPGQQAPEGYPAYGPPRYPDAYGRPDYLFNYPPPAYNPYYPPYPIDRRLNELERNPQLSADNQPPKDSWWQQSAPKPQGPASQAPPRSLEVTPAKPVKEVKQKTRKLRDLTAQQRALANLMKPYFRYLKTHRSVSIDEMHSAFTLQFRSDNGFFESNFWPIIQSNFDQARTPHIRLRRIESQIAQRIFKVDLAAAPAIVIKQITPVQHKPKLVAEKKLGLLIQQLSIERAASHDSSDSLAGFQVRPDFQEKYRLLHALYLAENRIFHHPASKPTIIASLHPFKINTATQFRDSLQKTVEYFTSVASQFKVHRRGTSNQAFVQVIDSVRFMVKSIRNKTLGRFFLSYVKVYTAMHIHRNNPTQHQRQSLNLAIGKLITELGPQAYLTTVYRIIHETRSFRRMQPADPAQSPPAFPIFQQLFQNQIRSGSLRFLLAYYFQSVSDKVSSIENLIFMDDSRLLASVRFDFRRLFIEFVHDFNLPSFREFNTVLTTVSGQIETVLRRAPSTPTKSYFSQFIAVYSKIAFQVLGRYFHLSRQAELFSVYAQTHEIGRQFYPENYSTMVHGIHNAHHVGTAVAAVAEASIPKVAAGRPAEADVQRIIFELSQYLDNPNGVIFNSEAERQSVLNVINSILKKANSSVLSKKSFMMVNRLKDEIDKIGAPSHLVANQPISTSSAPQIDLPSELEQFRLRLKGIHRVNPLGNAAIKISMKFLEDSAVVTKFLITLFQLSTQAENGLLLALTAPFVDAHTLSPEMDAELERLYATSRLYTDHYEALFSLAEVDKARLLWKVLMRFYSRECHLELYKQLTMRIAMLVADPDFQANRFSRVKKIVVNLMLFLSKNQNFDLKKDCEQASLLITRKRLVNDLILKRTFLLNSFKKIFLHVGKGGKPPGDRQPDSPEAQVARLIQRGHELGKHASRRREYRDFTAEMFPELGAGGKRLGQKYPPDEENPDENNPPGDDVPPKGRIPPKFPPEEDERNPPRFPPDEGNRNPPRFPPEDGDQNPPRYPPQDGQRYPPSIFIKRFGGKNSRGGPPGSLEKIIHEKEIGNGDPSSSTEKIIDRGDGKTVIINEKGETQIIYRDRDSPSKSFIKVSRSPPTKWGAITLLQAYLGMYGSPVPFPPEFDWEKAVEVLDDGDWGLLLGLMKKYGKDVRNVGVERSTETLLKLREIIAKINPPKPILPPEEAKKDCPPGQLPKDREETVRYAASMMDAFYQAFARKNDIQTMHKRIKFKVSPALLTYFARLSGQHPQEQPAQVLGRHPRVYSKIQKSLFFIGKPSKKTPPPEDDKPHTDEPPGDTKDPELPKDGAYSRFAQKVLLAYFRDRLRHGSENPQMLAKKLFKKPSPELEGYIKTLYPKPDCPDKPRPPGPPELTKISEILRHDEFKFYNRVIKHFYKSTDYLKFNTDAKKINARIFFKYLPSTKRQFVHRVFDRFGAAPKKFVRLGPVSKLNGLIQRVQFKYQAKCQSSCKSSCYKIVGGQQVELTDDDRKKWGINFSCNQMTDQLKLFDTNGNIVPSADLALYGCGCQCGGGKGGVQINEKPTLNFNINFETDAEARDFEAFLKQSDFLTKIKDSSVIDLEKLKRKYQMSKLRGVYDLDMVHKSYAAGKFDSDGFDTRGTGDPAEQFTDIDYNTPMTVGMPEFDDFGRRIVPGQKFTVNGEEIMAGDGKVKIPFVFGVSPAGEVSKLRKISGDDGDQYDFDDELTQRGDKRPGQQYVLSQKQGSPSVITQDAKYPIYYHLNDGVVGEGLDDEEMMRAQQLQETLRARYPMTAQNYPYKVTTTPFNFAKAPGLFGSGQARKELNFI